MRRDLLICSQVIVAIVAVGVRFTAPGWWSIFIFMSLGGLALILLAPLVIATITAAYFAAAVRARTVLALAVTDAAALTFALTLPDFTDSADDHLVPLATFTAGDSNVSQAAADTFSVIAGYASQCYMVAAAVTIAFVVLDQHRARQTSVVA